MSAEGGMRADNSLPWARHWQIAAVLLVLLAVCAVLLYEIFFAPRVPFLLPEEHAAWIGLPRAVSPRLIRVAADAPPTHFRKTFMLPHVPRQAVLHVKALREFILLVNGVRIAAAAGNNFRHEKTFALQGHLRPGVNEIRVDVRNARGPALLHLWISGLPETMATDDTWTAAEAASAPAAAALATDTRRYDESLLPPTPWEALRARGHVVLTTALACMALFLLVRLRGDAPTWLPFAALAGLSVFWVVLFVTKMVHLPISLGFDTREHLQYVTHIATQGKLPYADQGWSCYHPPLFYLLDALLWKIGDPGLQDTRRLYLLKIVPFLGGLLNFWTAFFLARRVFPEDPRRQFFATLLAGTLPMNLYLSAYVSNESLHAGLAGLAILSTVVILTRPAPRRWYVPLTGIVFGLALLTKITVLLVLGIACLFLVGKFVLSERLSPLRAMGRVLVLLLAVAVVSGWYFVRNMRHFGRPLVTNWGTEPNNPYNRWWQQPGFHTPAYFLHGGEVLRHPFFAGFCSFWDGIYSTLWGDGLAAGQSSLTERPEWNYGYVSASYLLALPMTVGLFLGLAALVRTAWREREDGRRLALLFLGTLPLVLGGAVLHYALLLASYACVKAFYALCLLGPLAILAAFGLGMVDDWLRRPRWLPLRALFYGWLGVFVVFVCMSFAG